MAKDLQYTLSLKDLFSRQMRGAASSTGEMDRNMSKLDGKLRSIQNLVTGGLIGAGLASFGKTIFNSLDNYQQFSVALRTMMYGDALAAKSLEGQLISLAKTTPFELTEVQDATRKLMAYGVAGGEVAQTIRTLGDVSAGLGKESFPFIIRAFGQIKSKGHLAGQELNQLTEQGFNPLNIIAKKTGESYDTLLKRMEKGKITFKEVEQSFKDVTKEGGQFFNMMEEQSRTVGGRWSNIADTWEQIKVNIGKSQTGILASTMDFISKMGNHVNDKLSAGNFMDEAFKSAGVKGYDFATTAYGNMAGFNKFSALAGNFPQMKEQAMYMQTLIEGATDAASARQNLAYINLNKEKLEARLKKGEVDTTTFAREMSLYSAAYKGVIGNLKLLKSKGNTTMSPVDENGKLNSLGKSSNSSGINLTAQRPQSLVINITELVHELKIQANDLKDSTMKIKEEVSKIFLEMVNDANLATR